MGRPATYPPRFQPRLTAGILLLLLLGVAGAEAWAQPLADYGHPYITSYTPDEYDNDGQCLDVAITPDGLVYVANSNGLMQFDGRRWRNLKGTENRPYLSLTVDRKGRVWAGGDNSFGIIKEQEDGRFGFTPIEPELPEDYVGSLWVWRVHEGEDGIYLQSPRIMLRFQPDSTDVTHGSWSHWQHETGNSLNMALPFEGQTWVKFTREPLALLQGDSLVTAPGAADFPPVTIFDVRRFDETRLLLTAYRRGMYLYTPETGEIEPYPGGIFDLAYNQIVYGSVPMGPDRFVATSAQFGVLVYDRQGNVLERVDGASGLRSNGASRDGRWDDGGGLWVPLDYGVARIELASPIRVTREEQGLEGAVTSLAVFNGTLYVGTSQSLYRMESAAESGVPGRFVPVPGVEKSTWELLVVGDVLVAGTAVGLDVIDETGQVTHVEDGVDGNTITLAHSRDDRHVFAFAELKGLLQYSVDRGGSLRFNQLVSDKVDDIRRLYWSDEENFWALRRGGDGLRVVSGSFNPDTNTSIDFEALAVVPGIEGELYANMMPWRGSVWVGTTEGLFGYDPATERFQPDEELLGVDAGPMDGVTGHTVDSEGRLWVPDSPGTVLRIDPDAPEGQKLSHPIARSEIRRILSGTSGDGMVHFGTDDSRVITCSLDGDTLQNSPPSTSLRMVRAGSDSILAGSLLPEPGESIELTFNRRDIRLHWTTPPKNGDGVTFQYRLIGYEEEWSEWSDEVYRDYSGLPVGQYQFQVRARNLAGQIGDPTEIQFVVLPPWYRTAWAMLLWVALLLLLLYGAVTWRVRAAHIRQRQLEELVQQRTQELEQARQLEEETEYKAKQLQTAVQMAATLAHEFNNPLAIIKTSCQLAETQEDNQRASSILLEKVPPQVDRMSNLIRKMTRIQEVREIDYAAGMKILDVHSPLPDRENGDDSPTSP